MNDQLVGQGRGTNEQRVAKLVGIMSCREEQRCTNELVRIGELERGGRSKKSRSRLSRDRRNDCVISSLYIHITVICSPTRKFKKNR